MSKGDEHHSSLNSIISLCTGCLPLWGINHHLMVLALISNPAKIHHHSITFFIALTLQLSVTQTCFHRCDFQLCSFMLSPRVLSSIICPKCCTENFVAFSYIASPLRFLHPIIFISCNKSDIPHIIGMVAISVFLILSRNKAKQNTGPCICLYRFSLLYSVLFASFPFPSLLQLSASGSSSPLQLFCWQMHIKIFYFFF